MNHAIVAVALEFPSSRAAAVEATIRALDAPSGDAVRQALHKTGIIHSMNLSVAPATPPNKMRLMIEIAADGGHADAAFAFCDALRPRFGDLLRQASIDLGSMPAPAYLLRRNPKPRVHWIETTGGRYPILPCMTVWRITNEARVAEHIGKMPVLRDVKLSGPEKLARVRESLWANNEKWAFTAEPAPFLANMQGGGVRFPQDYVAGVIGDRLTTAESEQGIPSDFQTTAAGAGRARPGPLKTSFCWAAYPALTATNVQRNAEIRRGIATARSEADADAWLAWFSSDPKLEMAA
jgi:hypothetical protein